MLTTLLLLLLILRHLFVRMVVTEEWV